MTIPVIILNYNSIENTKKCINSFSSNLFNYFFIVVDNNSIDKELLKKELKYTEYKENDFKKIVFDNKNMDGMIISLNENYGYSYANNLGLKLAYDMGFEYAIVANPDTEVINIDYFDILKDKLDFVALFPEVRGVKNEIQGLYYDKNWFQLLIFNYLNVFYKIYDRLYKSILKKKSYKNDYIPINYSIGCFILFNLKEFKKLGFFDSNVFLYGEEQILYQKIKKVGKKIYYSAKLQVKHNHYYKALNEFVKKEHQKSRIYYYKNYKKYPLFLIKILEFSSRFREETYEKIYSKLK